MQTRNHLTLQHRKSENQRGLLVSADQRKEAKFIGVCSNRIYIDDCYLPDCCIKSLSVFYNVACILDNVQFFSTSLLLKKYNLLNLSTFQCCLSTTQSAY